MYVLVLRPLKTPCRLPIDGPGGDPLYAEAAVTGRKKEAVLECATEACRMLDAAGLLRQSSHGTVELSVKLTVSSILISSKVDMLTLVYFREQKT